MTGAVIALDDPASVVEEMLADLSEFGPLQRYFEDPEAHLAIPPGARRDDHGTS